MSKQKEISDDQVDDQRDEQSWVEQAIELGLDKEAE